VSAVVLAVLALYPLVVYAGLSRFGARSLAVVLAVVCVLRLAALRLQGRPMFGAGQLVLACGGGVLLAGVSFVLDSAAAVRYYPVLVNGLLLTLFAASLASPPTVIERIARLREPELPAAVLSYTRHVTIAWAIFFGLNGAIALFTAAFAPLEIWALYNGLIAYLLIAALFLGELVVRRRVRARLRA
jgi:uncharacterized membrane protein